MSDIDPIAARLHGITDQLSVTSRRIVERDASGQVQGVVDVPTNVPRLVQAGIAVMDAAWSHHPDTVDAQGRFQQLVAMRAFCVAAAEQAPRSAGPMWERARQITNAIRLHYDDVA